ncbi:phosphate propanoyltransferase [Vagococcus fluvialis]|uniref:phosphate propanoyltransferase n=1 Tax=Vagococcus fluvialis TaxID=2738 RepID=UPI001D0B2191|nr:phosphate propanoyltransferase [Vagococcus fluvialis]UDM71555.1 phosphate propanoyltransferase [Vagococcus fluvialis]UDM76416.1 phosphate propanoyltransferase [Vagococcus fluvialis]UDM83246.1 phosphate propanoyltransferase [Vagococcus fluvialis]
MNEELIEKIVIELKKNNVLKKTSNKEKVVEIEASGRHIHLDRPTIDALFGEGHQLTKVKDLSQPGQFVCKERLTIVGPRGILKNVVVLGPERSASQVEISVTDSRMLGISVPLKESGQIEDTPGVYLMKSNQMVYLDKGLIVAKSHIHMTQRDAERWNLSNKELVQVKVQGDRPLIFDDVIIRVDENYATFMHIDYDEANACLFKPGLIGEILKKSDSYGV